ncbi:hypothetical protein IJH29_00540 [Candidatus Saccharibacteria bacterium]|nr:hypothetical protein [Candidatus Saccharibacteria bacterium]
MAKKSKIFSSVLLGVATFMTLSFASAHKPVFACGSDENGEMLTNCKEALITPVSESSFIYAESGSEVTSEKSIPHSYFLAGNQIASNDIVKGLAAYAGNLVNFSGYAEYAALAGNSITVSGKVLNDLFVAGNAVELGEDASIGRDVFGAASTILIKSNLHGNVFIGGDRLVLENVTIDGDLSAEFSEIVIKGRSSISGTFRYNEDARITGLSDLSSGATETYSSLSGNVSFISSLENRLLFLLGRLLVTIILVALAPKFVKKLLSRFSAKDSWKDLAIGLGLLLGVPLAVLFAAITVIGLPLALVGLGFYVFIIYLSHSVTGGLVGELIATKLLSKPKLNSMLKFVMGTCLVILLGLIPYVGGLITAVSLCFGFGYFMRTIFAKEK